MLPIFLRIVGYVLHPLDVNNFREEFLGKNSWEIIFGEEFLGKNSWGRILGEEFWENNFWFVCQTGRNAAHFSQNCWGHDVKNVLHPFDVNNF